MNAITIHHRVDRPDLGLGLVRVSGVVVGDAPSPLAAALDALVACRAEQPLSPDEEAFRKGSRDVLRNGRYKPTGRGKPANEYLARAATTDTFPRVNGPVDANNLVSLGACVPISLWDIDLANTAQFEVRLGRADETYVFNPSGQVLKLADLVCGCGLFDDLSRPMVTPIKDSMATKVTAATRDVAGCIYYPIQVGSLDHLFEITEEFLKWLKLCGPNTEGGFALAEPGQTVQLPAT